MWTKEQTKKWKEKHASICVDCSKPCSPGAQRCTKCEHTRRIVPIHHNCIDCSKPINPKGKGMSLKTAAKRCKSCAIKYRWAIGELRVAHKKASQKRNISRHGRKYKHEGYTLFYLPNHPKATRRGLIREHLIVWEEAHGKPLPQGWIIHHLNGIKGDNRLSNLQALPNKKHYLVLQAKAKRIQELEALLNGQGQLI